MVEEGVIEGTARQPRGLTLYQCVAAGLDLRTKDLFWLPPNEHANVTDAISRMALFLHVSNTTGVPGRLGDTKYATDSLRDPIISVARFVVQPIISLEHEQAFVPRGPPTAAPQLAFHRGPAAATILQPHARHTVNEIDHIRARVAVALRSKNFRSALNW